MKLRFSLSLLIFLFLFSFVGFVSGLEVVKNKSEVFTYSNVDTVCTLNNHKITFTREIKNFVVNEFIYGKLVQKNYTKMEIKIKNDDESIVKNVKLREKIPSSLLNSQLVFEKSPVEQSVGGDGMLAIWILPEIKPGNEEILSYSIDRELTQKEVDSYQSPVLEIGEVVNYVPRLRTYILLSLFLLVVVFELIYLRRIKKRNG